MLSEFLSVYALPIAYALLTAAAGAVGAWIGRIYKRYADDRIKQSVVNICCRAVEQLYGELEGQEKYEKAVAAVSEMLTLKGIDISELEIRMLIESVCHEFSQAAHRETAA